MRREYKIAHYPKENERAVYREDWDTKQWLSPQYVWTKNEKLARRYLRESDCISAFISARMDKWIKTEEEYAQERIEEGKTKQSWDELSSS
mgnify:CR=1 FL=1